MEAQDWFRTTIGSRPVLLAFLATAGVALALRWWPRQQMWSVRFPRAAWWTISLGSAVYAAVAFWYSSDPHFRDNAEPTMVATAWLAQLGEPIYHAVDAAPRYAHIYGPLAFQLHAAALWALGPSILVAKLLSASAAVGSVALLIAALRRVTTTHRALLLTGLAGWWLLGFQQRSFWTRPEPFELLIVAASIWIASRPAKLAAVGLAVCLGLLLNLKVTAPLYALPVAAFLLSGVRPHLMVPSLGAFALAVVAPFLVLDGASLGNYRDWIALSGSTGLLPRLLHQNLEGATFLLLIPVLAYHACGRPQQTTDQRRLVAALAASVGLVSVLAAKPGAGPYHLIPFLPVFLWLAAQYLGQHPLAMGAKAWPALATGVGVATLSLAAVQTWHLVEVMGPRRARNEAADMQSFLAGRTGLAAMGYGSDESMSLQRPELVFKTGVNLIDQPAIREYQLQGLALPQRTLDAIADCRVAYWFVPRGEEPFSGRNSYDSVFAQPMYPEAFRTTFLSAYGVVGSTTYFDVWGCRTRPSE